MAVDPATTNTTATDTPAPDTAATALPIRRATFGDQLRRNARRHPNKTAIVALDSASHARREYTYAELDTAVNQMANSLAGQGIGHGDVVAIMGRNTPELVITFWAAAKLGAAVTGLNYTFLASELHYQLSHSEAKALVCEDALVDRIEAITDPLPELAIRITNNADSDAAPTAWLRWYDLLASGSPDEPDLATTPVTEHSIGLIPYTSGTEALPKAVVIPQRNYLIGTIPALITGMGLTESDVWYYLLPLHTIAGLGVQIALISLGNTIVLPFATDPQRALDTFVSEGVTCSGQTPTFFLQLIGLEAFQSADLTQLRRLITYGGTMPRAMFEAFGPVAPNLEWITFWSQSELAQTPTVGRFRSLDDVPNHDPSWIGKPTNQLEVRVIDSDGNDAEEGELICRSPGVMAGYLKNPDRTAEVLRDGWLHTGDIVSMDADGNIFFRDRMKDLIKSGGMNVSSVEVERMLYQHDAVLEVAVVGLADEYWGQTVNAYVVLRPGTQAATEDLRAWCKERLAPYKVPKTVHLVEALPKDTQGKTLKRKLRG